MSLRKIYGDITVMETDAVVNAANSSLMRGGGVCGALFAAADAEKLQKECSALAPCGTGEAVITGSYGLPCRYIVHAVGPVWRGGGCGEARLLRRAYTSALRAAYDKGCRSIAFPLISAGIYGYPYDKAMDIAESAVLDFLEEHEMEVYLVLLDKKH